MTEKVTVETHQGAVVPMGFDAHTGAVKAVYPIQDALLFVHGATGCSFYPRILFSMHDNYPVRALSSGLEQRHVIFGGGDVLVDGLRKAVKTLHPKLIVIQGTCIPLLTGDDLEGIAREVAQETGAMIIATSNPNFKGNQMDGFQNVILAYIRQVMKETGEKIQGSVNLLGVMPSEYNWRADLREIRRILKALGIKVNSTLVGYDTTVEEIIRAPKAEANILLYPEVGLPTARLMEERFGIPCIETTFPPIGISSSREWILKVAEHFGLQERAETFLEEEMGAMGDALGELDIGQFFPLQYLFGRTYALKAMPFQIPALVRFLWEDLSLRPTTIAFQEYDEGCYRRLEEVLQDCRLEPEVQTRGDHLEFFEAITHHHNYPYGDPWLVFGSTIDALELAWEGHRLPVVRYAYPVLDESLVNNQPFVGLRGVAFWAERIHNELVKKLWGAEDAAGNFPDFFSNVKEVLAPFMAK